METNDKEGFLASEWYGERGAENEWLYSVENGQVQKKKRIDHAPAPTTGITNLFKSVFLPQGYPHSVSDDYVQYQLWDTAQAFCSSLSGTLATQASLKGVGVGNQEATVAAATVTWLLRDGTGMLGRILFAWLKGSQLDSDAKKWRLFADILNDIAMFMEILAPFFPAYFLLIVCTAGVFKSIVGVAGGATRAALTVHQARRDNMADISAKDGSQETMVNLAGLLVSLILIPLVTDNPVLTLSLFFLFTVLHLVCNYKAVRAVVMETFNEARLDIVWKAYLQNKPWILTPAEANAKEPVFIGFSKTVPIRLGVRLQEVVQSPEEFNMALNENYLLGVSNGCICICLRYNSTVEDEFRAMCHALSLRKMLSPHTSKQLRHWDLVKESQKLVNKEFGVFMKTMDGYAWDKKRNLFERDEWRVDCKTKHS